MKMILVICIAIFSQVVGAEEFGRLFSAPETRANLETLRRVHKEVVPSPVAPPKIVKKTIIRKAAPKPVVLPEKLAVQGYVRRTDGKKSTIWINNQAVQEGGRTPEYSVGRLGRSSRVPIRINANGKRVAVKAGQTYSPVNNQTMESPTAVHGDIGAEGDDAVE